MANKKIIIFDMDGVLINSIGVMFELTSNRYPGVSYNEYQDMFKGNIHTEIDTLKLKYSVKERTEEEHNLLRSNYTQKKIATTMMYPHIDVLLFNLKKQNYLLAINSSASGKNTFPILERLDIAQYFERILLKEDSLSKVEKFKMLMNHFECEPEDIIFITDTVGDVKEAAELNIQTIAVTWGVHTQEYFEEVSESIFKIVSSVKELEKILTEL